MIPKSGELMPKRLAAQSIIFGGQVIKTVQANLGHATASFTLDVYGHASQKMRQRSADRMEQYTKCVL